MSATRQLLAMWEALLPARPAQRAIELAAVAGRDTAVERVGDWSVGGRDEALMTLRSTLFGPSIDAVGVCPECGEQVEITLDLDEVRAASSAPGDDAPDAVDTTTAAIVDEVTDESGRWVVTSRVPTAADLVAIESAPTPQAAEQDLWARCVVAVDHDGRSSIVDALPPAVRSAVVDHWERTDPLADVRLDLVCPACEVASQQAFDIAEFVWDEVDTWARRLLGEIHVLARAYGWSEDAIVALSPLRRRCYLDLVA